MALQKTITEKNNFGTDSVLTDCYIRVDRIIGGKLGAHATVCFMSPSKDAVYLERSYEFTPTVGDGAKDFVAQAYDHMKTLPEFEGAVDC
jgi:hypothetical protein